MGACGRRRWELVGETQIDHWQNRLKVSYPDFFDDIFALGANLEQTALRGL